MAWIFRKLRTYVFWKWKRFVSISGVCGWGFFKLRKRRHVAARRPYVANQFSEYKGSPTLRILDPRPVHDGQPARQGFASRGLQFPQGRTGKLPGRGPEVPCRDRHARAPSVGVRACRPWQGSVGRRDAAGRGSKFSEPKTVSVDTIVCSGSIPFVSVCFRGRLGPSRPPPMPSRAASPLAPSWAAPDREKKTRGFNAGALWGLAGCLRGARIPPSAQSWVSRWHRGSFFRVLVFM